MPSNTSNSLLFSVIAGLAIGVALIVLFGSIFVNEKTKDLQSYRDKDLIDSTARLEAVKVFLTTYKNGTAEVDKYGFTNGISVVYYYEKLYENSPEFPYPSQYHAAELIIPIQQGLFELRPDISGMTLRCSATGIDRHGSMSSVLYPTSRPDITITKAIALTACAK